jgi:hypothetical protein
MSRFLSTTVLGLVFLVSSFGCVSKVGIVRLSTDPPGAKYYLDGIERGITPAEFEWDAKRPIILEIKKEGFHPEQELLNKEWVWYQESRGKYAEIRTGKSSKQWTVTINRKLKAAPPGVASGAAG